MNVQKVAASSLDSRACLLLAALSAQTAFHTWLEAAGRAWAAAINTRHDAVKSVSQCQTISVVIVFLFKCCYLLWPTVTILSVERGGDQGQCSARCDQQAEPCMTAYRYKLEGHVCASKFTFIFTVVCCVVGLKSPDMTDEPKLAC